MDDDYTPPPELDPDYLRSFQTRKPQQPTDWLSPTLLALAGLIFAAAIAALWWSH